MKFKFLNFLVVSHNLIIPGRSTRQDAGRIIKSPIKSESINFVIWFLEFSRLILKFVLIIDHCSITANVMSASDSIDSLVFENGKLNYGKIISFSDNGILKPIPFFDWFCGRNWQPISWAKNLSITQYQPKSTEERRDKSVVKSTKRSMFNFRLFGSISVKTSLWYRLCVFRLL